MWEKWHGQKQRDKWQTKLMGERDLKKLRDAGFRVFRMRLVKKTIYENTGPGIWKPTRTIMDKDELFEVWNELLKNPKHIAV